MPRTRRNRRCRGNAQDNLLRSLFGIVDQNTTTGGENRKVRCVQTVRCTARNEHGAAVTRTREDEPTTAL